MTQRVTPGKFIQQVKQEATRVTWPNRKETTASTITVLVMVVIAAAFFLLADWIISSVIRVILGV